MSYPKVSIIVLNWNGLTDTVECLESLRKLTYPDYSVIVVDNGSSGDDVQVLRERFGRWVHILENDRNYGFAEGNNIGIRYAVDNDDPRYVQLLNNDTVVAPDFLTEAVLVAESDPSIGIVGPKIYWHEREERLQSVGGKFNWWSLHRSLRGDRVIDSGQFDDVTEIDWASGSALLITREAVVTVGLLYPVYFAYSEEIDWCARCWRAGYKVVFAPNARVWHKCSWSAQRMGGFRLYYMTRNRYLFMKRNATKYQFAVFFLHYTLRGFLVSPFSLVLRQRAPGLLSTFWRGMLAGMVLSIRGSRGPEERL